MCDLLQLTFISFSLHLTVKEFRQRMEALAFLLLLLFNQSVDGMPLSSLYHQYIFDDPSIGYQRSLHVPRMGRTRYLDDLLKDDQLWSEPLDIKLEWYHHHPTDDPNWPKLPSNSLELNQYPQDDLYWFKQPSINRLELDHLLMDDHYLPNQPSSKDNWHHFLDDDDLDYDSSDEDWLAHIHNNYDPYDNLHHSLVDDDLDYESSDEDWLAHIHNNYDPSDNLHHFLVDDDLDHESSDEDWLAHIHNNYDPYDSLDDKLNWYDIVKQTTEENKKPSTSSNLFKELNPTIEVQTVQHESDQMKDVLDVTAEIEAVEKSNLLNSFCNNPFGTVLDHMTEFVGMDIMNINDKLDNDGYDELNIHTKNKADNMKGMNVMNTADIIQAYAEEIKGHHGNVPDLDKERHLEKNKQINKLYVYVETTADETTEKFVFDADESAKHVYQDSGK